MLKICLIVAVDDNMGIGSAGVLPWNLPRESVYFRQKIQQVKEAGKVNAVLMGRKTWDDQPPEFRPCPAYVNIVLTRNPPSSPEGVIFLGSWKDAMDHVQNLRNSIETLWIIGGSRVYKMGMDSPDCHRIYVTRIIHNFECDVFFPPIEKSQYQLVQDPTVPQSEQEENGIRYRYEVYEQKTTTRMLNWTA